VLDIGDRVIFASCGIFFQKNIKKNLSIQIMVASLSALAPAKPLYNAQIGGAFYFWDFLQTGIANLSGNKTIRLLNANQRNRRG